MSTSPPWTDAELADMERRCDAATKGPWRASIEGRDHWAGSHFIETGDDQDIELTGARVADYDFIARARQDIPRLIAEVRALRTLLGPPS